MPAGGAAQPAPAAESPYRLNPIMDGIVAAAGTGLAIGGYLWSDSVEPITPSELSALGVGELPALDGGAILEFSPAIDTAGTVTTYGMAVAPVAALAVARWDLAVPLGLMYYEALALAFGTKDMLKSMVRRPRPYLYGAPDAAQLADGDSMNSFPSGHTTLLFTSAAYLSTVFADLYPDSPARHFVAGSSFVVAVAGASLRLLAGSHFLTDVVAGVAIGTLAGWLVPAAHRRHPARPPRAAVGVHLGRSGVLISVSL